MPQANGEHIVASATFLPVPFEPPTPEACDGVAVLQVAVSTEDVYSNITQVHCRDWNSFNVLVGLERVEVELGTCNKASSLKTTVEHLMLLKGAMDELQLCIQTAICEVQKRILGAMKAEDDSLRSKAGGASVPAPKTEKCAVANVMEAVHVKCEDIMFGYPVFKSACDALGVDDQFAKAVAIINGGVVLKSLLLHGVDVSDLESEDILAFVAMSSGELQEDYDNSRVKTEL